MLRMLDGAYTLRDLGNGRTEVTYRLALDVSIPLIGMLKRKGEKILIDTALKGLKKRVEATLVRVLLFTGKGGVGKSTVAAGTAALAAAAGHRTLVLSTDAAHSLADAFDARVGSEPTEVAERLFVQQVDAQLRFEQSWAEIQGYLLSVLDVAGVDPVAAEELTVIPGAEEVLALLELRLQARSGEWDVIVVDCAPTAETLRLLALPEALGWYMQRVFPIERRVVKTLRPVLSRAAGVPMPEDTCLRRRRTAARRARRGARAAVRPGRERPAGADARERGARRGPPVLHDPVPVRLPRRRGGREPGVPCRGRRRLARRLGDVAGRGARARSRESFAGLPVWRSVYRPAEPVGVRGARRPRHRAVRRRRPAGALRPATGRSGSTAPTAAPCCTSRCPSSPAPRSISRATATSWWSRCEAPTAGSGVGSYRRLLTLPAVLAKYRTAGPGWSRVSCRSGSRRRVT